MYSGAILGETYARIEVPGSVVILSPNHTGMGVRRSLWSGGDWEIPTGAVPIDEELAQALIVRADLTPDIDAHLLEHAIEVHLPFLQACRPDVKIVPVTLAGLGLEECQEIARGIAETIEQRTGGVLVVASTDMSHFLDARRAREVDEVALQRMLALDPAGLYQVVRSRSISMCGYIPTTVALFAAKAAGASRAELVRYGHSGETSGDDERVVGYAGIIIE